MVSLNYLKEITRPLTTLFRSASDILIHPRARNLPQGEAIECFERTKSDFLWVELFYVLLDYCL